MSSVFVYRGLGLKKSNKSLIHSAEYNSSSKLSIKSFSKKSPLFQTATLINLIYVISDAFTL